MVVTHSDSIGKKSPNNQRVTARVSIVLVFLSESGPRSSPIWCAPLSVTANSVSEIYFVLKLIRIIRRDVRNVKRVFRLAVHPELSRDYIADDFTDESRIFHGFCLFYISGRTSPGDYYYCFNNRREQIRDSRERVNGRRSTQMGDTTVEVCAPRLEKRARGGRTLFILSSRKTV